MKQDRADNGTFKAKYSNLGETVRMRIPRCCQKQIKSLLAEIDSLTEEIDPTELLSDLVESIRERKTCI